MLKPSRYPYRLRRSRLAACHYSRYQNACAAAATELDIASSLLRQAEGQDIGARGNADKLLAVQYERHGRRFPELAGLEVPKRLSILGVHCRKGSAVVAVENHSARGGKYATPRQSRSCLRDLPHQLAGLKVQRAQEFFAGFARYRMERAAIERLARLPPR